MDTRATHLPFRFYTPVRVRAESDKRRMDLERSRQLETSHPIGPQKDLERSFHSPLQNRHAEVLGPRLMAHLVNDVSTIDINHHARR